MLLTHSLWFPRYMFVRIKISLHLGNIPHGPYSSGCVHFGCRVSRSRRTRPWKSHPKRLPCIRRVQYEWDETVYSRVRAFRGEACPRRDGDLYSSSSHLLLSPSLVTRLVAAVLSDPSVPERPDKSVRLPEFQPTSEPASQPYDNSWVWSACVPSTAAKVDQQTFHKVSRPKSRRRVMVPLRRNPWHAPSLVASCALLTARLTWLRHGERMGCVPLRSTYQFLCFFSDQKYLS